MEWDVVITGSSESVIQFQISGQAHEDMYINRAGICILHPIKNLAGNQIEIFHTNGKTELARFPVFISPHQPFTDIRRLEWKINQKISAKLELSGDVFETEDHRNWTDNNYKTYSRSLDEPFPFLVTKQSEINQKVTLSFSEPLEPIKSTEGPLKLAFDSGDIYYIPPIGLGCCAERESPECFLHIYNYLSHIGFRHYRVEVRFCEGSWMKNLKADLELFELTKNKLELVIYLRSITNREWLEFIDLDFPMDNIAHIILLQENDLCLDNDTLRIAIYLLRNKFPGKNIGLGTYQHFAEINRATLPADIVDFISYPVNPQVHAFDDATLVENAEGQRFTVETATQRFSKPVFVTPVTLIKRSPHRQMYDQRQSSLFCAGWTLASLKNLIKSRVSAITFFALNGIGAIFNERNKAPYPVQHVFEIFCDPRYTYIQPIECSEPFVCTAVLLCGPSNKRFLLANHLNKKIKVAAPFISGNFVIKRLLPDGTTVSSTIEILDSSKNIIHLLPHDFIILKI
jgi:hypothetical protein